MRSWILGLCVLLLAGLVGIGGPGLGGSWEGKLYLFPDPYLARMKLTLTYDLNGWFLTSSSLFTIEDDYVEQLFSAQGEFGPFSVAAGLMFYPQDWIYGPYGLSWLDASIEVSGIGLTLSVDHFNYPYGFPDGEWPCATQDMYMLYSAGVSFPPFSLQLEFDDCCTGTAFKSLTVGLSKVSLCCGAVVDAELSFVKAGGFDYLELTFVDLLQLCCGISLDFAVTWTVDSKVVDLKPKLEGLGEGCLTVYADLLGVPGYIGGLELYGWKLRCSLGECTYVEFLHALNVGKVEEIEGDIFWDYEFEYLKFGVCGLGCCGGQYRLRGTFYFDNLGGLFGMSRVVLDVGIPLMANFTVKAALISWVAGESWFEVGWTSNF